MKPKPISCTLYDHFEIACMHNAQVNCLLLDGHSVEGSAITLKIIDRKEVLLIKINDLTLIEIELNKIKILSYEGNSISLSAG